MKKEGYKPSTIERRAKILKIISRHADLRDSEAVKKAIAEMEWSEGTKELACDAYALLARSLGFIDNLASSTLGTIDYMLVSHYRNRTKRTSHLEPANLDTLC
jgi:hypothetical protein